MKHLLIACLLGLLVSTHFIEAKENTKDHKNKQDSSDSKDHKNKQDSTDSKDHKNKQDSKDAKDSKKQKNKQDSAATVCNYASFWANSQKLTTTTPTAIEFLNDVVPAVGIEHPYQNDYSSFQIENDGIYHVSWTVTILWNDITQNIIDLHLFDAVNNEFLLSDPVSTATFDAISGAPGKRCITLSGQTILSFSAGDVLQLQLANSVPNAVVSQGLLTINQICE